MKINISLIKIKQEAKNTRNAITKKTVSFKLIQIFNLICYGLEMEQKTFPMIHIVQYPIHIKKKKFYFDKHYVLQIFNIAENIL